MNKYMEEANELAENNILTKDGGPFGAVILKNGEIISEGNNQVLKNNDPTAHAEITAIRKACEKLNTFSLEGCQIYTNCYPCPMCLSAIIWANIKTVYYGNTKEDAEEIGFRDDKIYEYLENLSKGKSNLEVLELIPMDREETIKTFEEFENKKDKIMY